MRIGGRAKWLAKVQKAADVHCAYSWASEQNTPVCVIGSGSNIIWTDAGYEGVVLKNDIRGFQIVDQGAETASLHVGAGEILDEVIERTVKMGMSGMECLSLIPGTCGGAIIQNSGAYGQEISQILQEVDVYDTTLRKFVGLERDSCGFGYRSSIFKNGQRGRYVILGFTVRLRRGITSRPSYPALEIMFEEKNSFSCEDVRSAVIRIRKAKLPDPAIIPNCGSFFTNPILSRQDFEMKLSEVKTPRLEVTCGGSRVSAAWLIEKCGLKDHYSAELGFGAWRNQPLVIFAGHRSSCTKLLAYSALIERAVQERFGVVLEREPMLMGD